MMATAKLNITQARKIVTIAYYTVLNRKPDDSGLKSWSNDLVSGKITETDLYYGLFTSKEYQLLLEKQNKR